MTVQYAIIITPPTGPAEIDSVFVNEAKAWDLCRAYAAYIPANRYAVLPVLPDPDVPEYLRAGWLP